MQIWLIRDGEKHGPQTDYQIREGIESGLYDASTPAWHEGMPNWTTLGEMAVFKSEFHSPGPPPTVISDPSDPFDPSTAPAPAESALPPSPANLFLVRRFWARWMDLQLYITVWWMFLYFTNRDIGAIFSNFWLMLLQLLPWLPIEALLIHRHGTTPGKWLLGIRVRNDDGSALSMHQSARRSLRVLLAGIGLGWGIISPICQGISYWITRRIGRSLWDRIGGHQVDFAQIRGVRYIAVIGVIYFSLQLQFAILAPYVIPLYQEQFPTLKEHFEKNPPNHFPPRHKPSGH